MTVNYSYASGGLVTDLEKACAAWLGHKAVGYRRMEFCLM